MQVYETCSFWITRSCRGLTTNNCWNSECPDYNRNITYEWIPTNKLVEELIKRDGVYTYRENYENDTRQIISVKL